MIPATIDTHIRVKKRHLPDDSEVDIKAALSLKNEDKKKAIRERVRAAHLLPEWIVLWRDSIMGDELVLPRGFASDFINLVEQYGQTVDWIDNRVDIPLDSEYANDLTRIDLRDHQISAVEDMLHNEQGIYKAPPGSGKTVAVLEAIRRSRQRAIILVDKSGLAEQWVQRAKYFLGVDIGFIGDQTFDPGEITVALKQTLWSRRKELQMEDFFDEWGFVAYDECHHVTADTYQYIVQQFPARYLLGVSATPARVPWTFPIAESLLGPVIHETRREDLTEEGFLVKPKIIVVPTNFDFNFHGTFVHKKRRIQNNYQKGMVELVENNSRNNRIVDIICRGPDHAHVVTSRRIEHLVRIQKMIQSRDVFDPDRVVVMTGKDSRERRTEIGKMADDSCCVILSTVLDEGIDIPRLDRLHLIWPERNIASIRQKIGRVERGANGKLSAKVFDYYDAKVGLLRSQFQDRMSGIYRAEGMEVEYLDPTADS